MNLNKNNTVLMADNVLGSATIWLTLRFNIDIDPDFVIDDED